MARLRKRSLITKLDLSRLRNRHKDERLETENHWMVRQWFVSVQRGRDFMTLKRAGRSGQQFSSLIKRKKGLQRQLPIDWTVQKNP